MIIHDFEQGTEEWLQARTGKITGTRINIFLNGRKDTIKKELLKLAAERITNKRCDSDSWTNKHMERGNELEQQAREVFSITANKEIKEVGFIERDNFTGCSPDGLIGDDGLIEIKCKDNHTFLDYAINRKIEKNYYIQMQYNMWISERDYCHYIVYNPNFNNPIVTEIVKKDVSLFKEFEETINNVKNEIDLIIKSIGE